MQAWSIVKVKQEGEHLGRAGIVQTSVGTANQVKLDETETHEEGVMEFADEELTFLGQG